MSEGLKRKAGFLFVTEVACIVLLGAFLMALQTRLSIRGQHGSIQEKIGQMQGLLEAADMAAEQNMDSYDDVYQAKAASVAYIARKDEGFQYTDANMAQLADRFGVTNLLVLDREGRPMAKAHRTAADFTYGRYNQLRTVFGDGAPSEAFEVVVGDVRRRYYGARIDEDRQVVIEQDPEELHLIMEDTSSWKGILDNVSVGLKGYAFAISSQDYTFLYHPDETMVGTDALSAGVEVGDLEDGHIGWMDVRGERLYCGVARIGQDNAYIICAVPEGEITASRDITVGIVLFIFFAVITVVVVYALLMLYHEEREGSRGDVKAVGGLYFDMAVARKIGSISVVGLLSILIVSFYMQTLFSLTLHSVNNDQRAEEVRETIERNERDIAQITSQYNERYLNKCQIASYILGGNQELWTREELEELSQALDVEFILIFSQDGRVAATNSTYTNFQLSSDPDDQSFEFNKILQGAEYVIQEAQADEVSGRYHQYIGSILYDAEGNADGFVQISVTPQKLEEALAATRLSMVLGGIRVGTNGFAFAVDKEDLVFSYYPRERMAGKDAVAYGMTEKQFRDGYGDYITVDGQRYYGSCLETGSDFIYIVVPEGEMTGGRLPVSLISSAASLICLLLVFLLLTLRRSRPNQAQPSDGGKEGPLVEVVMPDGSVRKTRPASTRWTGLTMAWGEKTPEQQIASVLRGIFSALALAICVSILFKDRFFEEGSIFRYVLEGRWERGVNVFAVTGCIMIICVVSVAVMALRKVLHLLAKTFGARGETVCRLISNFVKYVAVIAVLYYCLALFGVDTRTLLASAGILSLVIGLGAKSLVSDILAGLFIIFEGEFQVGDIVTIGDWRGTVLEIGVRTTKIEDAGNNVKIISNSDVSGVINMTRRHSFASCDVGIEYGESLERVENILEEELPNIRKRVPAILDGPFYKGVVSLGDNSVNIRIVAQCSESSRMQVARDLNREMKILFDRYDIDIPFPQVVINQPKEFQKATDWERYRADEFNKSQKELAKGLEEDEEEHT